MAKAVAREWSARGVGVKSSALGWHNHPSGDPTPSREDMALTKRLRTAGDSLGVPLADHIIVGDCRWHSFRAAEAWDQ